MRNTPAKVIEVDGTKCNNSSLLENPRRCLALSGVTQSQFLIHRLK